MKLLENEGKALFKKYGISIPKGELVFNHTEKVFLDTPYVLKAQVPSGDRKKVGGIIFVNDKNDFGKSKKELFSLIINNANPRYLLAEQKINFKKEIYVSFSYDTKTRSPVLAISKDGGSGIEDAEIYPIDLTKELTEDFVKEVLKKSGLEQNENLTEVILNLWKVFTEEKALLAEINPLFETEGGKFIAGDAKVILDDSVVDPKAKPFLELGGDIAVIASGGGASLLNLDALIKNGGRPANYVEYSGNPSAESVRNLTKDVLDRTGLKGLWVVGGTANFTDIYETMSGFLEGLKDIEPRPKYPIVIRRDGPRQKEAFLMLKEEGQRLGFDFHLFGPETPMMESAKTIVKLAYK